MFALRFFILLPVLSVLTVAAPKGINDKTGATLYADNCSACHGLSGMGSSGPAIVGRMKDLSDNDLWTLVKFGQKAKGMPALPNATASDIAKLIDFLRSLSLSSPQVNNTSAIKKITVAGGLTVEGKVLDQSSTSLDLQSSDHRIHLLRVDGDKYREANSQSDWTSYNGDPGGNRYSSAQQIQKANVSRLTQSWKFDFRNSAIVETTPIVVEGVMYITSANECYALDSGTGAELWHFRRERTRGVGGFGGAGMNRGAAWAGSHLFITTDDAQLVSLNRFTGEVEWESVLADWQQNYDASSAPLVAGDLVISGTGGGDRGARGFLAAYDIPTGKEVWRFWTVPAPGQPGSETWKGNALPHGGAVTWLTGSYDSETDTVFWGTGNPGPSYDDSERGGDNLYSDCVVALDRKTGALKWHYQFTPHDVHDWDATEPLILVNIDWQGQPRKLLATGNRNGFFYVLDRTNGQVLMAQPFVKKLNWAKQIGPDHRPVLAELPKAGNQTTVCPSQDGATNWFSSAFSPSTGFFYLQALEKCDVYTVSGPPVWQAGHGYLGGTQRTAPGESPAKVLRALDLKTGKTVWEYTQPGRANTWGGVLATAGGLVFVCADTGLFSALDSDNGKELWNFPAGSTWHASPMTYTFDGKQFIAVAAGRSIISFSLPN